MLLINIFYAFTYQATYTSTTANNVNYWENGFRLINLCNLFIEGVHNAVESNIISEEAGDAYESEARVLRAITYHTLVIHFARPYRDGNGSNPGLPIFESGVNSADEVELVVNTSRSTVAEVYDFILEDLDYAEQFAITNEDYPITRASEGAAIALKSRIYLHMGDWQNVITEANKLTTSGQYALGSSVETPWNDNESSESIFSMEMSPTDNLNTNAALARMLGSPSLGARGEYAISPIIWNQSFWHSDDLRRTLLVEDNGLRYFTSKYRDYAQWTDYSPIIRYAEVILNLAEAEGRQNGITPIGLAHLNSIRDRAISGNMISYTMADFPNATTFVQAVLNERRIELLAEGHRWSDIHRNAVDPDFTTGGIPSKMISADVTSLSVYTIGVLPSNLKIEAIPYSDYRFLWPIPDSETSRNPTLLGQQNPGY
jgi:hypothetical protein